jgi:hypothetical protein
MRPPGEHGEESHFEAHEGDEHHEEAARLTLGGGDEEGDEHADHREDGPVEDGVAGDQPWRHHDRAGIADALHGGGAEQRRGAERLAPSRVEDEEPHGDDGCGNEPCDDAFAEIPGSGVHERPPLQHAFVGPPLGGS